jgi:outer membrane protein assembly factor BamB
VEWDTKVASLPAAAVTVSNDLLFIPLFNGEMLAVDRHTGKIVYRHKLPTAVNAPIAIAGRTIIVPAGGAGRRLSREPQVVAYTVH